MPRLHQVSRDEAPPDVRRFYERFFGTRDPVAEPGTSTGTPGNWWTMQALSPGCMDHAAAGARMYRSTERKLSPQLREIAQTRAGYARGSRFVYSQHCKEMRSVGCSEDQVQGIAKWPVADCFSPVERTVLAYTDCLVYDGGRVPDGIFEALQGFLSDEEIYELTYITCMYEMFATMSRALRAEYDDVPERVVEVPAPKDASGPSAMAAFDD